MAYDQTDELERALETQQKRLRYLRAERQSLDCTRKRIAANLLNVSIQETIARIEQLKITMSFWTWLTASIHINCILTIKKGKPSNAVLKVLKSKCRK